MTYKILDNGVTRDATPDEAAEIDARANVRPTVGQYIGAVQAMLDAKAAERNYDNILSACTYAVDTNPKFQAEGRACVEWRSAVWSCCYELMDQVTTGAMPPPAIDDLLAMLPTMEWPA